MIVFYQLKIWTMDVLRIGEKKLLPFLMLMNEKEKQEKH